MSRSGYSDDLDQQALAMWRGAVNSAIRGKRGQKLLREVAVALDAMPVKALVEGELQTPDGDVCALGAVGRARGIDMSAVDPEEYESVATTFDISEALSREIMYVNDEALRWLAPMTPEKRWLHVRSWVANCIGEHRP